MVKFILVEFGLGKFNMFDCSLVKSDVTNKQKENKQKNMMTCRVAAQLKIKYEEQNPWNTVTARFVYWV